VADLGAPGLRESGCAGRNRQTDFFVNNSSPSEVCFMRKYLRNPDLMLQVALLLVIVPLALV
jgi:hypothetical protein